MDILNNPALIPNQALDRSVSRHQEKTNHLNKILRGEMSAVEAYEQVIEKFAHDAESLELAPLKADHEYAVMRLKQLLNWSGENPSEDSGIWGTTVAAVVGAAKLAGEEASLKALIAGERHGLDLYREALTLDLTSEERLALEKDLMHRLQLHMARLERMINDKH